MWDYAGFGNDISTAPHHAIHTLNRAIAAFVTAFNNDGTTMFSTSQPCAVCDDIWHNFFTCPDLHSTPVPYVASSLVNSLTFASESGGGKKPPTTKMTTLLKAKANTTANVTTEPKANNARVLLGLTMMSMATKRVAKVEAATINGKVEDCLNSRIYM